MLSTSIATLATFIATKVPSFLEKYWFYVRGSVVLLNKKHLLMTNNIIVLTPENFSEYIQPILKKLDLIEGYMARNTPVNQTTYNDMEASRFLKVSKKKLQQLRNDRKIGFIREDDGRRILYTHEHLMEYLQSNELKKKK